MGRADAPMPGPDLPGDGRHPASQVFHLFSAVEPTLSKARRCCHNNTSHIISTARCSKVCSTPRVNTRPPTIVKTTSGARADSEPHHRDPWRVNPGLLSRSAQRVCAEAQGGECTHSHSM